MTKEVEAAKDQEGDEPPMLRTNHRRPHDESILDALGIEVVAKVRLRTGGRSSAGKKPRRHRRRQRKG